MSHLSSYGRGVMNMKSIRRALWSTKRTPTPPHVQLELNLPASRLTRSDVGLLEDLRRLREELARQ